MHDRDGRRRGRPVRVSLSCLLGVWAVLACASPQVSPIAGSAERYYVGCRSDAWVFDPDPSECEARMRELCPHGYDFLESPDEMAGASGEEGRSWVIECRPAAAQ